MPPNLSAFSSIVRTHAGRDILNPEAAEELAARVCQAAFSRIEAPRAREAERWMRTTARKRWIKEGAARPAIEAETQDPAKPWAPGAFAKGNLAVLELSEADFREARSLADWMLAEPEHRLTRMPYKDALTKSQRWHDSIARAKSLEEDPKGIIPVAETGDGLRWVEVISAQSLSREGALLNHCVGSYAEQVAQGACRIFSLRDATNKPLLTVEAQPCDKDGYSHQAGDKPAGLCLAQIRGKANALPGLEVGAPLRALLDALGKQETPVLAAEDLGASGCVFDPETKKLSLIDELPAGHEFKETIEIHGRAPANLSRFRFLKGLVLSGSSITEDLEITAGFLRIENCRSPELHARLLTLESQRPYARSITVNGLDGFSSLALEAPYIYLINDAAPLQNWRATQGPGAMDRSHSLQALLPGIFPIERIAIKAQVAEARDVAAREIIFSPLDEIQGGHRLALSCCRAQTLIGVELERDTSHCIIAGAPVAGVFPEKRGHVADRAFEIQEQAFSLNNGAQVSTCMAERLMLAASKEAHPRRAAALSVLSEEAVALPFIGRHTMRPEEPVIARHGGAFYLNAKALEARALKSSSAALELALSAEPHLDWVRALRGEWDPALAPQAPPLSASFSGTRHSLLSWAQSFRNAFPGLATDIAQGRWPERVPSPAREMLRSLSRARFLDDGAIARIWQSREGAIKGLRIGVTDFDPDLEAFGKWLPASALSEVAMPDRTPPLAAPPADATPGPDIERALIRAYPDFERALLEAQKTQKAHHESSAPESWRLPSSAILDHDQEGLLRQLRLATTALHWPFEDIPLVSPPEIPVESRDALALFIPSMEAQFCAALGAGISILLGRDASTGAQLARALARMLFEVDLLHANDESMAPHTAAFFARELIEAPEVESIVTANARERGVSEQSAMNATALLEKYARAQDALPLAEMDLSRLVGALSDLKADAQLVAACQQAAKVQQQARLATSAPESSDGFSAMSDEQLRETIASNETLNGPQAIAACLAVVPRILGERPGPAHEPSANDLGAQTQRLAFWLDAALDGDRSTLLWKALREGWRDQILDSPLKVGLAAMEESGGEGFVALKRKAWDLREDCALDDWDAFQKRLSASPTQGTLRQAAAAAGVSLDASDAILNLERRRETAKIIANLPTFTQDKRSQLIHCLSHADPYLNRDRRFR